MNAERLLEFVAGGLTVLAGKLLLPPILQWIKQRGAARTKQIEKKGDAEIRKIETAAEVEAQRIASQPALFQNFSEHLRESRAKESALQSRIKELETQLGNQQDEIQYLWIGFNTLLTQYPGAEKEVYQLIKLSKERKRRFLQDVSLLDKDQPS